MSWRQKVLIVIGLLIGAYCIYAPVEKAMKEKPLEPPKIVATTESKGEAVVPEEKIPLAGGRVFAFALLGLALVGIIVTTCVEKKKAPWAEFLLQPVFVAISGAAVFCALLNLFIYPAWRWIWDNQLLFWGTSLSIPLYVFSKTRKEPWVKSVARVIAFMVLCGFFFSPIQQSYTDWQKYKLEAKRAAEERAKNRVAFSSSLSYGNVPTAIALPIIGEAESPGEPGGKQFNEDGSVVHGMDKDDIGALQINQRIHADLIKETGIDIAKSKEDNYKFGNILVEKYSYQPWFKTRHIWGPKLAAMGYGQGVRQAPGAISMKPTFEGVMDQMNSLSSFRGGLGPEQRENEGGVKTAPVDNWSHLISVPRGSKRISLDDGFGDTKKFSVRWNGRVVEDFPREEGVKPKTPKTVYAFQLKSREAEALDITVKFLSQ